ncbi:MAG: O-antigen ligase domain-containing protein, partial [Candidatus Neomarinimicrobiota bacterium]
VTLITDYFGWTKFTLLFSQEIYNEAQSGRGAGILGGETNFTAARLSTLLPFAIYLMLKKNALKYSSFWAIPLVLLILLGVILTGSRMGYLAVAQIVLVLVFYEVGTSSWTGKLAAVLTVVVLMGIGAYSFTLLKNQSKALLRLQSLGSIQDLSVANLDNSEFDDSLLNRFILFWIGVHIIQTHPLMGVGIGNAKYIPPRYFPFESQIKYLHNTYLEFGAENGLPALLGFLLFLGYLLVRLGGRGWRSRDDFRFYLALGLYILLFNWFFLTDLYNKLFWVVFLPVTIRFLQADRGSHDVSR